MDLILLDRTIQIFVIMAIFAVIVVVSIISYVALTENGNQSLDHEIIPANASLSCNCVAFRLDDVMDKSMPDEIQYQIIDLFVEKEIPLTIGIIGNKFGNDTSSVKLIKEYLQMPGNRLEIANHGWNHEDFAVLSLQEQIMLIKKTNDKLDEKLEVFPRVFIPPFNRFNEDTIQALKENEMTHMSSILSVDVPPYPLKDSTIYRFPATSTTAEFSDIEKKIWTPWSGNKTFNFISKSMSENGFAVVMMHPRDFGQFQLRGNAVNYNQLQELDFVIQKIIDSGWKFVLIGEINLDS